LDIPSQEEAAIVIKYPRRALLVVTAVLAMAWGTALPAVAVPQYDLNEESWIDGRVVETYYRDFETPPRPGSFLIRLVAPQDPDEPQELGFTIGPLTIPSHDHVLAHRQGYGARTDCRAVMVIAGPNAVVGVNVIKDTESELIRAVFVDGQWLPLTSLDAVEAGIAHGLLSERYIPFEEAAGYTFTCWTGASRPHQ
jgi:hypothetical protein